MTNAVSWRSEGIRYRKNEVFLDVVESLNLLVSSTGSVLRSEILGAVKMKCYLSGMPELRLGLNDKAMFETTGRATRGKAVEMEDVKFHQCVRLSRFENDRTISFIPPDGEFELMSYRLNTQVKPLIWVESEVRSHSGVRMEYVLKVSYPSSPPHHHHHHHSLSSSLPICSPTSAKPPFRLAHSLSAARQPTMSKSSSPYPKMPIALASGPTSDLYTMRRRNQPSYGRSNNLAVAKNSSCEQNLGCRP